MRKQSATRTNVNIGRGERLLTAFRSHAGTMHWEPGTGKHVDDAEQYGAHHHVADDKAGQPRLLVGSLARVLEDDGKRRVPEQHESLAWRQRVGVRRELDGEGRAYQRRKDYHVLGKNSPFVDFNGQEAMHGGRGQ